MDAELVSGMSTQSAGRLGSADATPTIGVLVELRPSLAIAAYCFIRFTDHSPVRRLPLSG